MYAYFDVVVANLDKLEWISDYIVDPVMCSMMVSGLYIYIYAADAFTMTDLRTYIQNTMARVMKHYRHFIVLTGLTDLVNLPNCSICTYLSLLCVTYQVHYLDLTNRFNLGTNYYYESCI